MATLKLWKISSNVYGDSNYKYKFLLTNIEVAKLFKCFANNYSLNTKLSKPQLHKIG